MDLPILYKKASDGKIQLWGIDVDDEAGIMISFGQVGGVLQHSREVITKGKNIGRANATTPQEQAECEALARHTKQRKKGYVESVEAATSGEVDEVIVGGIFPMLAPSKIYPHFAAKLSFPVFVQPKFDGTRLIAVVEDGECTLWSRTRKRVNSLPHIAAALEAAFPVGSFTFDGEAYRHSMNDDFEGLMSLIRSSEPSEGHEVIEYHIYDLPSWPATFALRHRKLGELLAPTSAPLVRVRTEVAADHSEIMAHHEHNLEAGYEGSMIRGDKPYEEGRRSYYLQKLKNFTDAEYQIVGADEGRGKDAGTVGSFVCVTPEGKEFRCRLKATYARRAELFASPEQWRGKSLTVAFQNLTADGIPRFPVGKAIRDGE